MQLLTDVHEQNEIYLDFKDSFNKKVDNLLETLMEITFGRNFNQSVDMLPQSTIILKFGYDFNQSVDMLPRSAFEQVAQISRIFRIWTLF